MPLLPAPLIEPLWEEFATLIGADERPEFARPSLGLPPPPHPRPNRVRPPDRRTQPETLGACGGQWGGDVLQTPTGSPPCSATGSPNTANSSPSAYPRPRPRPPGPGPRRRIRPDKPPAAHGMTDARPNSASRSPALRPAAPATSEAYSSEAGRTTGAPTPCGRGANCSSSNCPSAAATPCWTSAAAPDCAYHCCNAGANNLRLAQVARRCVDRELDLAVLTSPLARSLGARPEQTPRGLNRVCPAAHPPWCCPGPR